MENSKWKIFTSGDFNAIMWSSSRNSKGSAAVKVLKGIKLMSLGSEKINSLIFLN